MNKTVKTILITAACMIPAGVIIAAAGIHFGGKPVWAIDFGNAGSPFTTDIDFDSVALEDLKSLKINVSSADVSIIPGKTLAVKYRAMNGFEPDITQEGGTVTITQVAESHSATFGFTPEMNTYKITVPEGTAPFTLDLKSASGDILLDGVSLSGTVSASSGDITISDISGSQLSVTSASGDISCESMMTESTSLTTASGDISITGSNFGDVCCKASSGNIGIIDSQSVSTVCEALSGDVTISYDGDENEYSFDLRSESGDINLNGRESEGSLSRQGNSDRSVTARTGSGDIDIIIE